MQGEIGVFSPVTDGRGTCFWFTLPFHLQSNQSSPSLGYDNLELHHHGLKINHLLREESILVVDANLNSRKAIGYYLRKFGAEVNDAANIAAAIAYLESGKQVDAILIDWQLTGFNGSEIVQKIHHKPSFANLSRCTELFTHLLNADQSFSLFICVINFVQLLTKTQNRGGAKRRFFVYIVKALCKRGNAMPLRSSNTKVGKISGP